MYRVSLAASAAFATLLGLVAAGDLTTVDQWAVDHAMPGAWFGSGVPTLLDALVPLEDVHWHGAVHVATAIVTFPASFTPATLLVALACLVMRGRAAVALAGAYVVATAIEVIVKSAVTRPTLDARAIQIVGFDDSFPSGHTIRAVFVVVAVAWLCPKARIWAAAWAVCALAFVELGGLHVPSDIVGGLLVAAATLPIALRLSRSGAQ